MASENTKRLYKHYLSIAPRKDRQAKVLLERFPELGEKEEPTVDKTETVEKPKEEPKKDGKKPKR